MDPQEDGFFYSHHGACHADSSQGTECKAQSSVTARKVHKADRERMRRDKLNEQFMELGTTLDPDRPRHDKATILGDTVQMLKDLTSQVNKLKAEYSSLFEEECELTKEKNELWSEKASLKSDVDNLNNHYQQRIQMLYPWTTMEPSVLIGAPPSYPFSLQVPIPAGAVTMHPQLQPCPFFQNQTLGAISNPCTHMAYSQSCHAPSDQPSSQFSTPVPLSSSNRSHSPAQDCRSKSPSLQQASCGGRNDDFGDVATDLELKTPGSSAPSHSEITNKDSSSDLKRKEKQCIKLINGSTLIEDRSSSRCSSIAPPPPPPNSSSVLAEDQ
ncbi:hypothetical protein VPH35_110811 [Triticum aestivum]